MLSLILNDERDERVSSKSLTISTEIKSCNQSMSKNLDLNSRNESMSELINNQTILS